MINITLDHQDKDGELSEEFVKLDLDNAEFIEIESIDRFKKESIVYELEVEGTPNYQTDISIVHNGGGKRAGSFAMYLELWHADIFEFLELKKNHGKEELRARDLFYAMWTSDLFMERVNDDADWSLMSSDECPGLQDAYGANFNKLYEKYEEEGKFIRKVKAREIWNKVLESQKETGGPYMTYKDAANMKSNQKNIGTIKSSNLCTEIMEVSSESEVAVCNLGSISLSTFVKSTLKAKNWYSKKLNRSKLKYDFDELYKIAYQMTINLNRVIDINYYPIEEARNSNMKHRPIGIGVQGLADTFAILGYAFDSAEAKKLNKDIFETIYFAAMSASNFLAERDGAYDTYEGSPVSEGIFQFDMWEDREIGKNKETKKWEIQSRKPIELSGMWDWDELKGKVKEHGVRNSLLLAPMPTASTAQILGNNECFEAFTSNIYSRRTLSGEFAVVNKHLVKDLSDLDLWNDDLSQKIINENGSVQNIPEVPTELKEIYKTVWEIKTRDIIDMSADRGAFICQSQSLNLNIRDVTTSKLTNAHFYGWLKGLKTGMYYLRTNSAVKADANLGGSGKKEEEVALVEEKLYNGKRLEDMTIREKKEWSDENPSDEEGCIACGS